MQYARDSQKQRRVTLSPNYCHNLSPNHCSFRNSTKHSCTTIANKSGIANTRNSFHLASSSDHFFRNQRFLHLMHLREKKVSTESYSLLWHHQSMWPLSWLFAFTVHRLTLFTTLSCPSLFQITVFLLWKTKSVILLHTNAAPYSSPANFLFFKSSSNSDRHSKLSLLTNCIFGLANMSAETFCKPETI